MSVKPPLTSLPERVDALKRMALDLRARVDTDALRARLDVALSELEQIPVWFADETRALQALLIPAGRIRTVEDILGTPATLLNPGEEKP